MENVTEIQENVVCNNYTEDDETRMRESVKRNIIEEPQLTACAFQNLLLTWRMSVPLEPSRDVHEFLTQIQGLLKQLEKK